MYPVAVHSEVAADMGVGPATRPVMHDIEDSARRQQADPAYSSESTHGRVYRLTLTVA